MDGHAKRRADGRVALELRAPVTQLSVLNRADGSARFSVGRTSVLAAVYGPLETKTRNELLDRARIEVLVKPKSGLPSVFEKEMEQQLRSSLEVCVITTLHPRTAISVVVQVLSDDGSVYSAAVNCVSLALLDAGIPMNGVLAAVECIQTGDELILDLTKAEEQQQQLNQTPALFTFSSRSGQLSVVSCSFYADQQQQEPEALDKQLVQAIHTTRDAADQLFGFYRLVLQANVRG